MIATSGFLTALEFRMHQIRFRPGFRPGPHRGSLQRSPDPLAGLRGPTSKGRGGKEEGKEEGKGGGNRRDRPLLSQIPGSAPGSNCRNKTSDTVGRRSSPFAASILWNSLPPDIQSSSSLTDFCHRLWRHTCFTNPFRTFYLNSLYISNSTCCVTSRLAVAI